MTVALFELKLISILDLSEVVFKHLLDAWFTQPIQEEFIYFHLQDRL